MAAPLPDDVGQRVHLGGASAEFVSIRVLSRAQEPDFWDGNWMTCDVTLRLGGFQGAFQADLRTTEFQEFYPQLQALYAQLSGTAQFTAMEEQLILTLEGDGRGHIAVHGQAQDVAGTGHVIRFRLELDQTELGTVMRQVAELLQRYPVRGTSAA
jgi:hypothetical protein